MCTKKKKDDGQIVKALTAILRCFLKHPDFLEKWIKFLTAE